MGFRSQVKGDPRLDPFEVLDRRVTRFMGKGAAWNYLAMQQAIADGWVKADGKLIYEAKDLRVGLFTDAQLHEQKSA